jgi:hypothetical protein
LILAIGQIVAAIVFGIIASRDYGRSKPIKLNFADVEVVSAS